MERCHNCGVCDGCLEEEKILEEFEEGINKRDALLDELEALWVRHERKERDGFALEFPFLMDAVFAKRRETT